MLLFVFLVIFCHQKNVRIYAWKTALLLGLHAGSGAKLETYVLCGGVGVEIQFFPPKTGATVGLGLWYLSLLHAGWTPPLEKPAGRGLRGSS